MHRADAAVILCAGGSRRMGRPKGLLDLGGEPLVARHVAVYAAWAARVVVVLGASAAAHRRVLPPGVVVVENADWEHTWPADSLRLGLELADVVGACWVTPVDVAPPRASTLEALLTQRAPAVPTDPAGQPGHPVLLDPALTARVRLAAPLGGLRTLLGDAAHVRVTDPWVAADFDDPAAWQAYLSH